MKHKTVIGLDVGRSAVKVVAAANGVYRRIMFSASVTPAFAIADEHVAARAAAETVDVGGTRYVIARRMAAAKLKETAHA